MTVMVKRMRSDMGVKCWCNVVQCASTCIKQSTQDRSPLGSPGRPQMQSSPARQEREDATRHQGPFVRTRWVPLAEQLSDGQTNLDPSSLPRAASDVQQRHPKLEGIHPGPKRKKAGPPIGAPSQGIGEVPQRRHESPGHSFGSDMARRHDTSSAVSQGCST